MRKLAIVLMLLFFANRVAFVDYTSEINSIVENKIISSEQITHNVWHIEKNKHYVSAKVRVNTLCAICLATEILAIMGGLLFLSVFIYAHHIDTVSVVMARAP